MHERKSANIDYGERISEDFTVFDMEYAEHGSLLAYFDKSHIQVTGPLVSWIGRQVRDGLAYLHERSILHGDLKPGNILVFDPIAPHRAPHVKIGDLGSAITIHDERILRHCITTHDFAAPEMLHCEVLEGKITLAADIFSFAVLLAAISGYELPFQRPVRHGATLKEKAKNVLLARDRILKVRSPRFEPTPEFIRLLAQTSDPDPNKRRNIQHLKDSEFFIDVQHGVEPSIWVDSREHAKRVVDVQAGVVRAKKLNDYLQKKNIENELARVQKNIFI